MRRLVAVGLVLLAGCSALVDLNHLADGPPGAPDAGQDGARADVALDGGADGSTETRDDVTIGLVGRWRFDETSGTVAADTSGKSNAGAVSGATWTYGPVPPEGALAFDGVADHVTIGGTLAYATKSAPFSFSAWFNVGDLTDTVRDIMQLRTDTKSPWHVLVGSVPDFQGISVGSAGSWIPIRTGMLPALDTWHHVAVIYDGRSPSVMADFAIFLDGVSQPLLAAGGYGAQPNESIIGASSANGTPWNGRLREVRIYNRALSAEEVAALVAAK